MRELPLLLEVKEIASKQKKKWDSTIQWAKIDSANCLKFWKILFFFSHLNLNFQIRTENCRNFANFSFAIPISEKNCSYSIRKE